MPGLVRLGLLVVLLLLAPIVPFVLFGDAIEASIRDFFQPPPAASTVALLIVAVLGTDVLLPVPSSFVSTFGGMQLPFLLAVGSSWCGMTLGACLGYGLAYQLGPPLLARLAKPDDARRLHRFAERYAAGVLVATRALPVLAETSVLLAGVARLSLWRFLLPVVLSNLGISVAYALLGRYGSRAGGELYVLAASLVVPIAAAALARVWLSGRERRANLGETSASHEAVGAPSTESSS